MLGIFFVVGGCVGGSRRLLLRFPSVLVIMVPFRSTTTSCTTTELIQLLGTSLGEF